MRILPKAVPGIVRACVLTALLAVAACKGKQEGSAAKPDARPAPSAAEPAAPAPEPPVTDTVAAAPAESAAVPEPVAPAKPAFSSHPSAKAWVGKPWSYQPTLNVPGAFRLHLAKSADSSMKADKGRIAWTPAKPGSFPVILEAILPGASPEDSGARVRQSFTLSVEKVLSLSLKALPAQADKGDTVAFDLRGSAWPAWAAGVLTVRFDFDGDGKWDTEALPLPANALRRHAYDSPGRFAPKVEARYGDWETAEVSGAISVVSSVTPILKISPDTVEPGGQVRVDVGDSKADGRLAFRLDLDGDGKAEWADSSGATQATLKAPGSGLWQAELRARNPMGQEGKVTAPLRVNARPRLEFRVRNPKENMAAGVDFKAIAKDADDSIRSVRINFTGDPKDWQERAAPDSQAAGKEWWLRFKHAYGKVGKYAPKACVSAADGREACQELKVEIFNAAPICKPGPDVRATLGQPMAIDGSGEDPDGKIVKWEWDLDGDGKYDLASAENGRFQYTFSKVGVFNLTLRVTTADGMTAKGERKVEVRKKWKS